MNEQIVTEITRRAMATEFAIILPGESPRATEAAIDALDMLENLESRLTIYRPESEISRINQSAGTSPIKVSDDVFHLIKRASTISEITEGAFDVTAGPLVECWGFSQRRGKKPSEQEIDEAKQRVGWKLIELNTNEKTIFLRTPGMKINLGGIGKGFAIDQLAAHLQKNSIEQYLIHGGKSTILAATHIDNQNSEPFRIAIEHPLRPGRRLMEVKLLNGSIATSGSGKQFFHYKGKRIGHVIDPRTGRPAGESLSMTIHAENATDADAYSTACFVQGLQATAQLVRTNRKRVSLGQPVEGPLSATAITESSSGGDVELQQLGLDD